MKNTDYTVQAYTDDTQDKTFIRLEGNVGIKNVEKIRKKTLELVKESGQVDLTVSRAWEVDIAFLQFLYSLKKLFSETGGNVAIKLELRDDQLNMIRDKGLMEFIHA